MTRKILLALAIVAGAASPLAATESATLRGSPSSMERQNSIAKALDYTFLRTPADVREYVGEGRLVEIRPSEGLEISRGVSYPFARPELQTFAERLGAQYLAGCGEPLVITSLTRPMANQPGNAHALSVHPAGMAVDFRISANAACRAWLESTLLALEQKELLDVTRERNPPHYHVAVFPEAYMAYVAEQEALASAAAAAEAPPALAIEAPSADEARAARSDGLAPFALAVLLSVLLVGTMATSHGARRPVRS